MQGMGINSHPGSTYGPIQDMDMGQQHFEDMPPAPPQDNNQVRSHVSFVRVFPSNILICCRLPLGMTQTFENLWEYQDKLGHCPGEWPRPKQTIELKLQTRWFVDTNSCYLYLLVLDFFFYVVMFFWAVQIEFFLQWKFPFVADMALWR